MQIVACVSDFSSTSPTACNVYNAARIPLLTDNMADGIEGVEADKAPLLTFDGAQTNIVGDFQQIEFYSLSGSLVATLAEGENALHLPAGIYVVRALLPSGGMSVQKLVVK